MSQSNPRDLSQRELDALLDKLIERGEDERETPAWKAAHAEWERRESE